MMDNTEMASTTGTTKARNPALFDLLESTFQQTGATPAIEQLCAQLRQTHDYNSLFYALLMKRRYELGLNPLPTAPAHDAPESILTTYEEAIREAGRQVGRLFLEHGDVPQAWLYYRMIAEPEAVRKALDEVRPEPEAEIYPLIQIAYYEGVHVRKGFSWILERQGICSAITTLSSSGNAGHSEVDRQFCIQELVRALYEELRARLALDIETREGRPTGVDAPAGTAGVVRQLLHGRAGFFEEDTYHVDCSHLSAVVQLSIQLPPSPELGLARELCGYGILLNKHLIAPGEAPFEDFYAAHDRYLAILQGEEVETHLTFFREQAEKSDPEEGSTYAAEVLVNLLLRLQRNEEALAVARRYLSGVPGQQLTCPGVVDLCQRSGNYQALSEFAREQGDPVGFLAGLLARK